MIYPSDFENKIGFTAIRSLVSDNCISPLGRRYCARMGFMTDFEAVRQALLLANDMLALVESNASMPTENLHDVTASLGSVKVEGGFMSPQELYRLRTSLLTIARLKDFFALTDEEGNLRAPRLTAEFSAMLTFPLLECHIDTVINKYGEVSDNASPQLFDIRRAIASASASLSSVMRRVIDRAVSEGIVDSDTTPSMRDGRLVIPVASGRKRAIRGIVHDESASGKTSYIEPVEVVAASNRLRELQEEEKREIHRILVATGDVIRPYVPDLLDSYDRLGYYDFLRAKALVASSLGAAMPIMEAKPEIDWYGARHPLLYLTLRSQGRSVVPLDLHLDPKQRILLISGPNAGGKSVCLKTVGIVQYMLQCGMLPTMHSNSHASVFSDICIDIGDEQSIENDLSTYSSHLRNMKVFLRQASERTLILVDEMGSGTEPQIGGALAQAIIAKWNEARAMGVITTHYQNLKTYADNTPGLINGAMLYDRQNMQPLFKLSIGSPGSSFALEIAYKTGLPRDVIEAAKEIVGSDYVNMDKYLLDIARDRRYWQNKRQSIREKEARLEAITARYEEQMDDLKSRRREILSKAKDEAKEILLNTNRTVERTILEIRNVQAEKERTRQLRRELDEYKKQVSEEIDKHDDTLPGMKPLRSPRPKKSKPEVSYKSPAEKPAAITVNSYVRMSKGGTSGKVLSLNGREAEVAFGALRMRVKISELCPASPPSASAASQTASIASSTTDSSRRRQLDFKQDIDLRGMRADEALQAVTYFLDDAIQFGIPRVRILHGTGTGALRVSIRRYLQSVPGVTSFRDEDVRFGGAGITVVDLS